MNTRQKIIIAAMVLALVLLVLTSILFGGAESIAENTSINDYILRHIRIPKTITAIFAGAALALSGLVLQIIFRNPLAGPYVLGISSGASLMVAVSIMASATMHVMSDFFLGKTFIVLSAISGSFLITLLILGISKKVNSKI